MAFIPRSNNLSPFQLAIQSVVGKGKGAGANISAAQLGQIADSAFGGAPIMPGSQITFQDATTVRWRDPQGFEHSASRSLDGRDPNAGQWRVQTNRPAVTPDAGAQSILQQLQQRLAGDINAPLTFADIDPEMRAALQAITQARQSEITQQIGTERAQLLAQLFGRGVNESSIATGAGARFAEGAERVRQTEASDAANRELTLRNLLTTIGEQRRAQTADLFANLTGQGTQRDIASAGLEAELKRLMESSRQFGQQFELNQQQQDFEQSKAGSGLNLLTQGIGLASQLAGMAAGGIGAYQALLPKGGAAVNEANIRPRYFPSSQRWP